MTPEDIKHHFGADALNKLYDVILDQPVHELADWIFGEQFIVLAFTNPEQKKKPFLCAILTYH